MSLVSSGCAGSADEPSPLLLRPGVLTWVMLWGRFLGERVKKGVKLTEQITNQPFT